MSIGPEEIQQEAGAAANGSPDNTLAQGLLRGLGSTSAVATGLTIAEDHYVQAACIDPQGVVGESYAPERKVVEPADRPANHFDTDSLLSPRAVTVLDFLRDRAGTDVPRATLEGILRIGYGLSGSTAKNTLSTVLGEIKTAFPETLRPGRDKATRRNTLSYIGPSQDVPADESSTVELADVTHLPAQPDTIGATVLAVVIDEGRQEPNPESKTEVDVEAPVEETAAKNAPQTVEDFIKLHYAVLLPAEGTSVRPGLSGLAKIIQKYLEDNPRSQILPRDIARYVHQNNHSPISENHVLEILRRNLDLIVDQPDASDYATVLVREQVTHAGKKLSGVVYIPADL